MNVGYLAMDNLQVIYNQQIEAHRDAIRRQMLYPAELRDHVLLFYCGARSEITSAMRAASFGTTIGALPNAGGSALPEGVLSCPVWYL